jgi:hypothetical protein
VGSYPAFSPLPSTIKCQAVASCQQSVKSHPNFAAKLSLIISVLTIENRQLIADNSLVLLTDN